MFEQIFIFVFEYNQILPVLMILIIVNNNDTWNHLPLGAHV